MHKSFAALAFLAAGLVLGGGTGLASAATTMSVSAVGAQAPFPAISTSVTASAKIASSSGSAATPEQALRGLLTSKRVGAGCAYQSPPAAAKRCFSASKSEDITLKSRIKSLKEEVQGTEAIVVVVGRECEYFAGSLASCKSNSNGSEGLSGGTDAFNSDYDALSQSYAFPTYPCIKVGGKWLVNVVASS